MRLSELKKNQKSTIKRVWGDDAFRKRISEMGFVKGKTVEVIKMAPLKDPYEYKVMNYSVSLRKSEAELIEIVSPETKQPPVYSEVGSIESLPFKHSVVKKQNPKNIHVALLGNPNAGKTTFFNYASGAHERVGNFCGITVSVKKGSHELNGYTFNISDLPGTYSLSAITPDEFFVINHLLTEHTDVVINVVDASNLERNLYLTMLLTEMGLKVVVALNMYDEMIAKNEKLEIDRLSKKLGVPIIPTISIKGQNINNVFEKVIELHDEKENNINPVIINYGKTVEQSVKNIAEKIPECFVQQTGFSKRSLAIRLIERDVFIHNLFADNNQFGIESVLKAEIGVIEKRYNIKSDTLITNMRYGFIASILKQTYRSTAVNRQKQRTKRIDNLLTHKYLGFPIFFIFMYIVFFVTFKMGDYPMQWIENLTSVSGKFVSVNMVDGTLKDLLVDGIITGVGGVLVFLPNILILFFFISFMEDSGYMARVVFIMDKLMRKIGLHGKSFVPLMMGFGCNVPAIMSSRILENKSDRLITILVNPFMSCSARLPIYLLIIGTFFISYAPLILFSIYTFGILLAIVFARVFRKYLFPKKESPFVLELPPYRMPTLKSTVRHMWYRAAQYLKKISGVILIASIIIWTLSYFPRNVSYSKNFDALMDKTTRHYKQQMELNPVNTADLTESMNKEITILNNRKNAEQQSKTYIARIGKIISPVMEPLGFDWKMSVSIITGLVAKEVIISTMSVLYQDGNTEGNETLSLREKIKSQHIPLMVAIAFLIFVLIYFPCISVIVTVAKETHWKWALFIAIYTTLLAWVVAFLINQIALLF